MALNLAPGVIPFAPPGIPGGLGVRYPHVPGTGTEDRLCEIPKLQLKYSCILFCLLVYFIIGGCMGRSEKLLKRLLSFPRDFTFGELETLLAGLGYQLSNSGNTSGSAVRFINHETGHIIRLHRPHPSPVLKQYIVRFIINELTQEGYLYDR